MHAALFKRGLSAYGPGKEDRKTEGIVRKHSTLAGKCVVDDETLFKQGGPLTTTTCIQRSTK